MNAAFTQKASRYLAGFNLSLQQIVYLIRGKLEKTKQLKDVAKEFDKKSQKKLHLLPINLQHRNQRQRTDFINDATLGADDNKAAHLIQLPLLASLRP